MRQAPKKDKGPAPSSKPAKSGGGKQKKKVWCACKVKFRALVFLLIIMVLK